MNLKSVWLNALLTIGACITLSPISLISGGAPFISPTPDEPFLKPDILNPRDLYHPSRIQKKPGHYTLKDWRAAIDSCWGPGLPTDVKLQIFDQFWWTLDSNFACFNNITVNWDSLRQVYRDEISRSVSRGRFAAIMNHLALALTEGHTTIADTLVNWWTYPSPGVPLLALGGWNRDWHFGAGLTPLPDSSLLVYRVVRSHPLGLVRGDIVLGYDRIPWKVLYKELLATQLPLKRLGANGSADSTFTHSFLMAAGSNWHLFDTMDVVKFTTGDTVHLSTAPLQNTPPTLICTEQMDIPGVLMPDFWGQNQCVSYGIVSGTQVGYIYGWAWMYNAENEFFNALDTLTTNPALKGLIIDFRMNYGGNMFLSNKGLRLLFRDSTYTIGLAARYDPANHYAMRTMYPPPLYSIPGNGVNWYGKPIAVLTGPGAVSSGDQVALRMRFHPRARFFGKSTNTAFNGPIGITLHPQWSAVYAAADAYLVSDTTHYLTHIYQSVDVPVWLTPEDVAQGYDTVVRAALAWIDSVAQGVSEPPGQVSHSEDLTLRTFPNPITNRATLDLTLARNSNLSIKIYNVTGQVVSSLVRQPTDAGRHTFHWDARSAPNGIYFCQVTAGSTARVFKMTVLK